MTTTPLVPLRFVPGVVLPLSYPPRLEATKKPPDRPLSTATETTMEPAARRTKMRITPRRMAVDSQSQSPREKSMAIHDSLKPGVELRLYRHLIQEETT